MKPPPVPMHEPIHRSVSQPVPQPAPSAPTPAAAPVTAAAPSPLPSFAEPVIHSPAPSISFHEAPSPAATAHSAESGKRLYAVISDPKPGAIVIHCSDPRFQAAFEEFLEHELGLAKGGYIPIVVGGGAGVLGHPEQLPKEFKFLKERLEHYREIFPTARRIILINHEGCRYYQHLKSRALAIIGSRLHMPLDLGRDDLSLVAESFRHFLSHLGYHLEYYYAKFADPEHTHIEIEKVAA
jgi:hypothetical protein